MSRDDSVRDHVPELPDYAGAITLRHLIHHISGLRDYPTLMYMANKRFENAYDDHELLDLVVRQREVAAESVALADQPVSGFDLFADRVTGPWFEWR